MKYARTGMVLCTQHYRDCVDFYTRVLGLPVLFALDQEHSILTCCDMGGSYLMIEPGGPAQTGGKTLDQNPVYLRFNVTDLDAAIEELRGKGVKLERRDNVWGSTAVFTDPDGNRCQLRDEASFGA